MIWSARLDRLGWADVAVSTVLRPSHFGPTESIKALIPGAPGLAPPGQSGSDVASAILRGRLHDRLRARLAGKTLCITFVTLGELTTWTVLRSWGPRKLADLVQWRSGVVLLPFDEAVATTWGQLQARAQHRGRPRPTNDSGTLGRQELTG
ncbi:hypothetical protein [Micromonospora yangpuensis]|uniref:hypothetical protein n=1 Tax=Micromonospora yangpuensis TaxID=683228 RepID=UPI001E65BCF0|nr:hypothetical protein [Micromonospora yangpuensis]